MGSFPSGARSAANIAFCKEPGKVFFVKYEILGFEIWNRAQGIRNPTKNGIWNQYSTEKKIRSPVAGIWNPWLGIQNLRLSWIEKKKRHVSSLVSLLSLLFVRSHYLQWFSGPLDKILRGVITLTKAVWAVLRITLCSPGNFVDPPEFFGGIPHKLF